MAAVDGLFQAVLLVSGVTALIRLGTGLVLSARGFDG